MRRCAVVAMLLVLAACSDVRDKPLGSVDFNDPHAVQSVALELQPKDRAAFQRYVTTRIMSGAFGGVGITRPGGELPATVGEAIDLTKDRMAIDTQRDELMKERNAAVERHNALQSDGSTVSNQAEWDRLENVIADYDKKIAALDARPK